MADRLKCITPVDGTVYVERALADHAQIETALERARKAAGEWRHVPVHERQKLLTRAVDAFVANKVKIAEEISRQMGRPISQSPGEVRGFEERARYMATLKTVSGGTLTAMWNGPSNIVIKDEKGDVADITVYDVLQSNGVIHSIDKVLLPK